MLNAIKQTTELSHECAVQLCLTAITHANTFPANIGVVVLTPAGIELSAVRMNQAPLHAINIARKKAYTAASFKVSSQSWQEKLKHKPDTMSALLREDNFTYLGGGLPVMVDNEVIGAIGVSGATEAQDVDCAEQAITALLNSLSQVK
ncbi:GlcG/HbpS family heme-binding protein [Marinomonas sp. TW1]|uniref:GlcG/HbpS family heme-binding protein n=1 Tax=Marinomonas sp. TW1 TaxID=1561203 RepID=UPI0007AFCB77|nr:heme-binding protein [Marinomonas sp. TW1]KZN15353.1 hypothetical protein OA79_00770 [Marinomonas sp. TW1]